MRRPGPADARAPIRFFGGKGGAGKTTCAAAWALRRAETGGRVTVLSVDPAHALGDALARRLGGRATRVPTARGSLRALEVDAGAVLRGWLARRGPALRQLLLRGTALDGEDVDRLLDLAIPAPDELAALLELLRLRGSEEGELVVDTAPAPHTLRLLALPGTLRGVAGALRGLEEKHRFVVASLSGGFRPDETGRLVEELERQGRELEELLHDPRASELCWVAVPEEVAVRETLEALARLRAERFPVAELIVNRVTPPPDRPCALCDGRRRVERAALARLRRAAAGLRLRLVPLLEREPRGLAALRGFARHLGGGPPAVPDRPRRPSRPARGAARRAGARGRGPAPVGDWLGVDRGTRLMLFLGKGGVGKTTCAAAAAVALAAGAPERRVLLLSTHPGRSLAGVLDAAVGAREARVAGAPAGLRAREFDARAVLESRAGRYRRALDGLLARLEQGAPGADAAALRGMLEGASGGGLDELTAALLLVETLAPETSAGPPDLVVVDLPSTGQALRLIDAPAGAQEWAKGLLALLLKYREVTGLGDAARDLLELSRGLGRLRRLLQDPARTRIVVVTRPAELPALQTGRLLGRLGRRGLPRAALLVNAVTPPGCGRCARAAREEARRIAALRSSRASGRCAMILAPATAPAPRGPARLEAWSRGWRPAAHLSDEPCASRSSTASSGARRRRP